VTDPLLTRRKNLVLGALVADAAAMGLHWIYDQDHIAKLAPDSPEFRAPDAAHYDGVPAYFAHRARGIGDLSQYGEQALVMLRALLASGNTYDAQSYAAAFASHFGYGGGYVGYIDGATRNTLDNFRRADEAAMLAVQDLPFSGGKSVTHALVTKALGLRAKHTGPALRLAFEQAIRETQKDAAVVAHGLAILDRIADIDLPTGAHDMQLPAIAKLPPLVALLATAPDAEFNAAIASAVQTTSDHPSAAAFGQVAGRMMQTAVTSGNARAVADAGLAHGTDETTPLISDAIARKGEDNRAVTRHFGMACDLAYGVPSALHNILTAPTYTDAIRANIYAGGDTCGRAILVGAVMGALHGVGGDAGIPDAWVAKLTHRAEVSAGLDALLT
jgi:ADP-ribosylglycohydrolase